METHARAPDPLTNVGDMTKNWHSWKEDFIIFMKVTGYIDRPNEVRANLLKNRIGKVGIDVIQNVSFDNPQDKDDMDILITKLEEYFNPPKKEVVERYQFFTKCRNKNETIEQYINSLREKAKTCNFKEMTDSLIRDRIILDTHDKILRKKFFEATNLDLQKLVAIYNDYHINIEKMKEVSQENQTESTSFKSKPIDNTVKGCCWRCGHQHLPKKCPAWGSKCTKCGDVNHFTQRCRGPRLNPNDSKVHRNVLDPMQPQTKFISKSNENLWNNSADSSVTITIPDPINKTTFPDIPTNSVFGSSHISCDDTFDLVLHLLDARSTGSSLNDNNTASSSTKLHEKSQYSHSNMNETKSDLTLDLHYKDEKSEPKIIHAETSCEKWNDISSRNVSTENIYSNYNGESDEECSTFGATNNLQRFRYSPLMIFLLMTLYMLRKVLNDQVNNVKRHFATVLNIFVNIIFCSCISRYRNLL